MDSHLAAIGAQDQAPIRASKHLKQAGLMTIAAGQPKLLELEQSLHCIQTNITAYEHRDGGCKRSEHSVHWGKNSFLQQLVPDGHPQSAREHAGLSRHQLEDQAYTINTVHIKQVFGHRDISAVGVL